MSNVGSQSKEALNFQTEREKLVAEMDAAAAEWRRVDAETYDHAGAEWDRAYDALAEYDRTHGDTP